MRISLAATVLTLCAACTSSTPPTATVVASAQLGPRRIITTATDVFWVDVAANADATVNGRIMQAPLIGGAVNVLADAQPCPVDLATDQTNIFWLRCDKAMLSAPAAGGSATTVIASDTGAFADLPRVAIAANSTTVYYLMGPDAAGNHGAVGEEPRQAGVVVTQGLTNPSRLHADATNIYWLDATDGAIYKHPNSQSNTPAVKLADAHQPMDLAIDATNVYWSDQQTAALHSVPIAGGTVVDYAVETASALAVDATDIYFIADDQIHRIPRSGGTELSLVAASHQGVGDTLALSADRVFWADNPTAAAPSDPTVVESVAK